MDQQVRAAWLDMANEAILFHAPSLDNVTSIHRWDPATATYVRLAETDAPGAPVGPSRISSIRAAEEFYGIKQERTDSPIIYAHTIDGEMVPMNVFYGSSYNFAKRGKGPSPVDDLIFMADDLLGLDPATGELLWRYAHGNQWHTNASPPLVSDGNLIFLSSPQVGARGLRIEQANGLFEVEELWSSRRIQFYHAAAVLQGRTGAF